MSLNEGWHTIPYRDSSSASKHPSSYQKLARTGNRLSPHNFQGDDVSDRWNSQLGTKQMTCLHHLWLQLDSLNYPESSPCLYRELQDETLSLMESYTFVNQPSWTIIQSHDNSRMWQCFAKNAARKSIQWSLHLSSTYHTLVVQIGILIPSIDYIQRSIHNNNVSLFNILLL